MKKMTKVLLILSGLSFVLLSATGCATMQRFFGPPVDVKSPKTPNTVESESESEPDPDTYSKTTQLIPAVDRNYKRMTKIRMEEESDLQAGAGSLWVMEGQKSFLFAQNNKRREGDPTSLKVEGPAMKQVQLKISTIQDLLNDLEEQKRQAEIDQKKQEAEKKRLAEVEVEKQKILDGDNAPEENVAQEQAEKIIKDRKPAAVEPVKVAKVEKEVKVDLKEIEMIPSKIVERVDGGLYRVAGFQTLIIKNRPYKVIATGLIRTDDFSDGQISSNKLVDPQFDVVHIKKDDRPTVSEDGVVE